MSRMGAAPLLALGAVLCVLCAPAGTAQASPQASLSIDGLPEAFAGEGGALLVPFEVTFSISRAVCSMTATYHVELTAAVTGQPGNASLAVQVVPTAMEFTFGPPQTIAGASQTHEAALHVARAGAASAEPLNGTATVHARVASLSGCGVMPFAEGFDTEGTVALSLEGDAAPAGQTAAMPGLAPLAGAAALAGLAILRRRRT